MEREYENVYDAIMNCNGASDVRMLRDRPYDGQPHTDRGKRGKQEISGITMRDLCDCFTRACFLAAPYQFPTLYNEARRGEAARLCDNDLYSLDFNDIDIVAVRQNMVCEVEKIMGIYPNVKREASDE